MFVLYSNFVIVLLSCIFSVGL